MNIAISRLQLMVMLLTTLLSSSKCRSELQPNDVDGGDYDDRSLSNSSRTICVRECKHGEPPRICYYKFHIEPYTVLSGACGLCPKVKADCYKPQCVTADGYERPILTVNRRLPAPSIQVCKGDIIIADVKNQMPGSSTTIHWHGIRQRLSPWMDGVPMVTQCPIMEGQTFRYRFLADEAGTYFWHSHDGQQKADGIVGSLVVREPKVENVQQDLYDADLPSHVVVIQDWLHTSADDRMPGLLRRVSGQSPDSYLINGRGTRLKSLFDLSKPLKTPVAKFYVHKGLRYRFRIVSGTCLSCSFRINVQGHRLKVISIDDNPVEPVTVDSIVLSAGERFDVVLEAKHRAAAYWILVRGLGLGCRSAMQVATLIYDDAHPLQPSSSHWSSVVEGFASGYTLNPRNSKCNDATLTRGICVSQLRSLLLNPPRINKAPDLRVFMPFGFHFFNNIELFKTDSFHKYFVPLLGVQVAGVINNISNSMPPAPLLTQLWDVPPSLICGAGSCQPHHACECVHIIKIPLGALVEFILVDTTPPTPVGLSHPFHIHGHDFYVVEQGKFKLPVLQALSHLQLRLEQGKAGKDREEWGHLPSKDTVTVPAAGYSVVRMLADNPGFWLYHCHFAYHLSTGMSAIIQVGEVWESPPPPPNFPRCNQFVPPIDDLENS